MADPLHLSLWYPNFETVEMLARAVAVMKQFPFSEQRGGIGYLAIHPVSWSEATVLERRFIPGVQPEEAAGIAADLLHDDYAYVFEAQWNLWLPDSVASPLHLRPSPVKFLFHGKDFDRAEAESGDIEIDFGLDSPFLLENLRLAPADETLLQQNVSKLVAFTLALEKNSGASSRLLWSESDENFAHKLISRLQKLQ